MEQIIERNRELSKQNEELLAEIRSLKVENAELRKKMGNNACPSPCDRSDSAKNSPRLFDDLGRSRSVVIAGIPESKALHCNAKVSHDKTCVRQIMDYLSLDWSPVAVYRMGKSNPSYDRLTKIVLPASYFSRLMLRRAS